MFGLTKMQFGSFAFEVQNKGVSVQGYAIIRLFLTFRAAQCPIRMYDVNNEAVNVTFVYIHLCVCVCASLSIKKHEKSYVRFESVKSDYLITPKQKHPTCGCS